MSCSVGHYGRIHIQMTNTFNTAWTSCLNHSSCIVWYFLGMSWLYLMSKDGLTHVHQPGRIHPCWNIFQWIRKLGSKWKGDQREKPVELHGYGSMRTCSVTIMTFPHSPCLTVLICSSENSWPFLYEDDFPATELSFPMNFSRLCWKWECSRVPDKNKCIVLLCFTLFYYVQGKSVYFPANAVVGTQVPKHLMVNPQGTSHYFSVQCH
jgi:hypothetical protein